MDRIILKVEGMSCSHCVNAVKSALTALEGVSGAEADLEGKTVTVEYNAEDVTLEAIVEAIEEEGYDVV
jgi:copper chaperone